MPSFWLAWLYITKKRLKIKEDMDNIDLDKIFGKNETEAEGIQAYHCIDPVCELLRKNGISEGHLPVTLVSMAMEVNRRMLQKKRNAPTSY